MRSTNGQDATRLNGAMKRKIIHVDMDCFYAAVEARDRPELRGKPVGVGGTPEGRGVIAAASYEARAFGVRSAMASVRALRLCPQLILVRPNFAAYKAESRKIRAIFERFTDRIEPLSLDEAYLDVTDCPANGNSATRIAEDIRATIKRELGLTASAGIAPNKFLAKVAGEWNKPDGQKTIRPEDVADFVRELPIEKIWGVGRVTAGKLRALGLVTCGDLQALTMAELSARFGSWGEALYSYARGEDDRRVQTDRVRKSLSVESTFAQDLETEEACLSEVDALFEEWDGRVQRARAQASWRESMTGIFVKLKFSDFKSITRETAFATYPCAQDFKDLVRIAYGSRATAVRLIGLGVRMGTETRSASKAQLAFSLGE